MPDLYDSVDYPGYAWSNAHPDRMAVMARLHGLEPAPVENCRVLEVGCNNGANLIPLAYAIPGSEFIGFDIAQIPVARAQQRIAQLGLTNASIFLADITQPPEVLGTFDYIIAHGVYTWVAEHVREALLALYAKHLAPNGIVFTSYSAYPGGHIRELVRDIFLQRKGKTVNPMQDVAEGHQLLQSIAALQPENDALGSLLKEEAGKLLERKSQLIFHDELTPAYRPVTFTAFTEHAARHGLSYVAESTVPPLSDPSRHPHAAAMARELGKGDPIAEEQLLDFVRMRSYRETLLCRAELAPTVDPAHESVRGMRFASRARCDKSSATNACTYIGPTGFTTETSDALVIAMLDRLIEEWPKSISFDELASFLETKGVGTAGDLTTLPLGFAAGRFMDLHTWEAPVSHGISEHPRASAICRMEASTHDVMTTLHHDPMKIDGLVKELVALLDGTRSHAELAAAIRDHHPEIPEAAAVQGTEAALQLLHQSGMLIPDNFRES